MVPHSVVVLVVLAVVTEVIALAAQGNYKMHCKRMEFQREMQIISQNSLVLTLV